MDMQINGTGLFRESASPVEMSHKVISITVTVLVLVATTLSLFVVSKMPILPSNRHFLYSLIISDFLQVSYKHRERTQCSDRTIGSKVERSEMLHGP